MTLDDAPDTLRPDTPKERERMSSQPRIDSALRETIMADPAVVLDDQDIMRALVAANERAMGHNIVDLRGLAMERLESRLDRLEDTHRSVIAAAYDNLAGTNQVHRAILRLLEPTRFEAFLRDLGGDVAAILRVDSVRLVIESPDCCDDPAVQRLGGVLLVEGPGFVDGYLAGGRSASGAVGTRPVTLRPVILRPVAPGDARVHCEAASVRSEACLRLDLGAGMRPGMLALGAEDPHHFAPGQGTDLLAFFGAAFERIMRRWLA